MFRKGFIRPLIVSALAFAFVFILPKDVYGYAGNNNYGIGSCSSGHCYHGAVWVEYVYTNKNSSEKADLPNNPYFKWNANYHTVISNKCRQYKSFFVLTRPETTSGAFTGYLATTTQLRYIRYDHKVGATFSNRSGTSPYLIPDKGPYDYGSDLVAKAKRYVSLEQAYDYYTTMYKMDKNAVNNKKWNANSKLGYFCYGSTGGSFQSKSGVSAGGRSDTSDYDSKVDLGTVELHNFQTTASVTFRHYIYTNSDNSDFKTKRAYTNYTIKQGKKVIVPSTKLEVSSMERSDGKFSKRVNTNTQTVSVPIGQSKKVCQTITYKTKNFTITESGFSPKNDTKQSKACVTVKSTFTCSDFIENMGTAKTINYGNTKGVSLGINHTTSNGNDGGDWSTKSYAKPSDEIQFLHCDIFGAQAVEDSTRANPTRRPGHVKPNYFYFSASPNNKYLFDRNKPNLTTKYTIPAGQRSPNLSSLKPDFVNPYEVVFFSPSITFSASSYATNKYNCNYWGVGNSSYSYQIPGFDPRGVNDCRAQDISVEKSDVGKVVSQSMHWNKVQAWINTRWTPGKCGCGVNQSAKNYSISSYPGPDSGRDSYNWGHREYHCANNGNCCPPVACGPYGTSCCYSTPTYRVSVDELWHPMTSTSVDKTTTASVYIPYNFKTKAESEIATGQGTGVVYAGEDVESRFTVDILERENEEVSDESYRTITPTDTKIQVVAFTINNQVSAGVASNILPGGVSEINNEDPCQYYTRKLGTSSGILCNVLNNEGQNDGVVIGAQNKDGLLHESESDVDENVTGFDGKPYYDIVPDVEAGSKYCVAVGISHADSHGYPDSDIPDGQGANNISISNSSAHGANPKWRISNASCRTVAKKPNVQVWGSIYSKSTKESGSSIGSLNGAISTSVSPKHAAASVSNNGIEKIFGSWSEVATIANGTVEGFASGAALGYIGNGGGANPSKIANKYCNMTKLTISNNQDYCNDSEAGYAGITNVDSVSLLNQIRSRYTPNTKGATYSGVLQTVSNNGAQYTYYNGDVELPFIRQTTGTNVIEVNGTLTITGDICSGGGQCGTSGNSLILKQRNTSTYDEIENLPQVIIIAKNIVVRPNVTQIDAWLFAEGSEAGSMSGDINTCSDGHLSSKICSNTLMFNGPVFAKTLTLNRTAGAYPGENKTGAVSATEDIASANRRLDAGGTTAIEPRYGSLTPAEIFNLRPDVYLWSYNQANRLTQATVVYMRELAPRY